MSTLHLRQRLIDIAGRDVGQKETSRNRGEAIKKFWPATSYPKGYANREPYCAAAMAYWVREWLKDPEVLEALKLTPARAEVWRCKSARAFEWIPWAAKKGLLVMDHWQGHELHTADIMVFDISHIGLVCDDSKTRVMTLEANTGNGENNRDGDGIWKKSRERIAARAFIRMLA